MKIPRIFLAFRALRELGPRQIAFYTLYQAGLRTGYFRWVSGDRRRKTDASSQWSVVCGQLLHPPDPDSIRAMIGPAGLAALKAEADEIVGGRVRLFGGQPVPLDLSLPQNLPHWTKFKRLSTLNAQPSTTNDIKFIWEPARFGWAFTLGRAYHLTGDERYPEAFWRYFGIFQQANPVNRGPNWISAQEVALRIIAFTFAAQIFASSAHSTPPCTSHLAQSIADHAARIPLTLGYARAQNNNHLLSEAAGLITAALALPDHPQAKRWSRLGWKWFRRGLETQIAPGGSYVQHSTNYHRLMLQLALWVNRMQNPEGRRQPLTSNPLSLKLQLATRWLLALTDPDSGETPNLGPNDGAYVLPLTVLPFHDYRPVLQAASQAFLGESIFEPGLWDEMGMWLQVEGSRLKDNESNASTSQRANLQPSTLHSTHSWAYLRAANFSSRPGHADQLHLDLWWRGLNIALDAGTYLYNADPPWDNALAHTAVHNTVMIDGQEQMRRAGRFLYLDRAQAEIVDHERDEDRAWEKVVARHNGYLKNGMIHNRSVTAGEDERWVILDYLQPSDDLANRNNHLIRLHWLLPDWSYELQNVECGRQNADCGLRIQSPYGWIGLSISVSGDLQLLTCDVQLVRAGELLYGSGAVSPTWGWVSPTYGAKIPALSFSVNVTGRLPLTLISEWFLPEDE